MGDSHFHIPLKNGVDAPHEPSLSLRQADVSHHENHMTLRDERLTRRESKTGLKGLFARNKAGKADKDLDGSSPRTASRPASIRASLADFGSWPYRHSTRSEASLTTTTPTGTSSTPQLLGPPRIFPANAGQVAAGPWHPPALFQVYPQAVKHATLPSYSVSVEALSRSSGLVGSRFTQEARPMNSEKVKGDTLKKRQRIGSFRSSGEWTSKIFVLITSGYLLQYAAEGAYNRVPEKILQLTGTSAAYASDLIPGRHWVLQVASVTDTNGNIYMEPSSRRSKIPTGDSARVSNMLLVFENPESMDTWLAVLRREIDIRGGKRRMSETGDEEIYEAAFNETNEELVDEAIPAKNPKRFSRIFSSDFSFSQGKNLVDPSENDISGSPPRRLSAYNSDYGSPTASMISYDGQRLDNLRNSSGSHRFSHISSGQRTMITSAGSSPACSPTRVSFSSLGDDIQPLPSTSEVRLRPNAAAIVNRRQSMQALISSFEAPTEQSSRPYLNSAAMLNHEDEEPNAPSVPNFSVPHTLNKRFSLNTSVPGGLSNPPQILEHERSSKSSRRTPPTALLMSRPLSIVIDQPSPRSPCSPNSLSRSIDSCSSFSPESNSAAAPHDSLPELDHETHGQIESYARVNMPAPIVKASGNRHIPRAASSADLYGSRRKLSYALPIRDLSNRRSSLLFENHVLGSTPHSLYDVIEWEPTAATQPGVGAEPSYSPKQSAPLPQSPKNSPKEKLITARRSMPQLEDGPPPAPPPSYALPPIPPPSYALPPIPPRRR